MRLIVFVFFYLLGISPGIGKEWKTREGPSFYGDFVSSEKGVVLIKTNQGNLVEIRRERLIESDLKFLEKLELYRSEIGVTTWPRKIRTRSEVQLTGGPATYHTEHFQIDAGNTPRATVAQLVTVMEDTLEAISTIPTGLELKPPAPATYFQTRFMDRASFNREFAKVGMHLVIPTQKVRGAYIAAKRELWLPVEADSLVTEELIPTLVHEVCHQTMHDWLPLLPVWFLEGFAEYMAAIPYENRTFRFDQSEEGLRKVLAARYQTAPSAVNVIHPLKLSAVGAPWGNTMMEYSSALVLVYFLIHLDGSGNGDALNRFVGEVARSREDASNLLSDLQNIADSYNSKVATYRKEIEEYQRKVAVAAAQMRSGQRVFVHSVSDGKLIIAGTPPRPPVPVAPGEAPIQQISSGREKTLDFITGINQRAMSAMIGKRSIEEFSGQMKEAYLRRGFVVNFF